MSRKFVLSVMVALLTMVGCGFSPASLKQAKDGVVGTWTAKDKDEFTHLATELQVTFSADGRYTFVEEKQDRKNRSERTRGSGRWTVKEAGVVTSDSGIQDGYGVELEGDTAAPLLTSRLLIHNGEFTAVFGNTHTRLSRSGSLPWGAAGAVAAIVVLLVVILMNRRKPSETPDGNLVSETAIENLETRVAASDIVGQEAEHPVALELLQTDLSGFVSRGPTPDTVISIVAKENQNLWIQVAYFESEELLINLYWPSRKPPETVLADLDLSLGPLAAFVDYKVGESAIWSVPFEIVDLKKLSIFVLGVFAQVFETQSDQVVWEEKTL